MCYKHLLPKLSAARSANMQASQDREAAQGKTQGLYGCVSILAHSLPTPPEISGTLLAPHSLPTHHQSKHMACLRCWRIREKKNSTLCAHALVIIAQ